MDYDTF
jgi:hypothetical protein